MFNESVKIIYSVPPVVTKFYNCLSAITKHLQHIVQLQVEKHGIIRVEEDPAKNIHQVCQSSSQEGWEQH